MDEVPRKRRRRNRDEGRAFAMLRSVRPRSLPSVAVAREIDVSPIKAHMILTSLEEQGKVRRVSGLWAAVELEDQNDAGARTLR
jgi:predicted Rossmann fold nucleotide-binding protein DprA/Smf involved in DNA uptake